MLESKLSNLSEFGFDLVEGKFRPRDEIKLRVSAHPSGCVSQVSMLTSGLSSDH